MNFEFQKATKVPIVLDVMKLTNEVWEKVYASENHRTDINGYALEAAIVTEQYLYPDETNKSGVTPVDEEVKYFFVNTLEDIDANRLHRAKVNDWLIVGIAGEIYACDADIFDKTYSILKEVHYND